MSRAHPDWAARARRMPVASAEDLKRWAKLAIVAAAVARRPHEFQPLIKARNGCRRRPFPAGHYRPDSPFYLLFKRAELWGALSGVERERQAPQLAELAAQAKAALDALAAQAGAEPAQPRIRKDIDG